MAQRIEHLNYQALHLIGQQNLAIGIPKLQQVSPMCVSCLQSKQTRERFLKMALFRATSPL